MSDCPKRNLTQNRFALSKIGLDMIGDMLLIPQSYKKTLGWKPKHSFESGIAKTIEWYLKKYATQSNQTEYG